MSNSSTTRTRFGSSLRQRISIAVVGITSVVVAIAAGTIWASSQTLLMRSVDQELTSWASRARKEGSAHIPRHGFGPGNTRGRGGPPRNDNRVLVEIIDAAGRTVFRSSTLTDDQTLAIATDHESEAPMSRTLPDGRVVRMVTMRFDQVRQDGPPRAEPSKEKKNPDSATPPPTADHQPAPAIVSDIKPPASPPQPPPQLPLETTDKTEPEIVLPVTVRFGFDVTRLTDELHRSAWMLAAMWAAATLLALGAVLVLRATILRPLDRLSAALERLGPDDLTARLPRDAGPDEVGGIVERLNDLLDRLQHAFVREQATIANIAHELRTPVAALRTDLEFRLLVASDPAERTMLTTCIGTVTAMQTQVTHLLLLARLEAGKEALRVSELDLVSLISEHLERHEATAQVRGHRFAVQMPTELRWITSGDHLGLLLDNVLGNALAHGQSTQPIDIQLDCSDPQSARIVIGNAFVGSLDPSELGKAYYRGDQSRHDIAHCGLGLALCSRLARLLGGTLTFTTSEQRFIATLVLPKRSVES